MKEDVFDGKSPDFEKLLNFGFTRENDKYVYVTRIAEGQFELRVTVYPSGEVATETYDFATDELYSLHLVEGASGAFVGFVRAEYLRVLSEVAEKCFERDVFKSDISRKLIKHVRDRYGDELQFLWKTFPKDAVWRRADNNKWYAAIMVLSERKLGLDSDKETDIIDLRIDPSVLPEVVDGKNYFLGYHMNKKNWFTIRLDGSVPFEEICARLDDSYALAKK